MNVDIAADTFRAPEVGGGDPAGDWTRVTLLFPIIGYRVGRRGLSRRLIWPGVYETWLSRRLDARVYRYIS